MKSFERKHMSIIGCGRMGQVYAGLFADDFNLNIVSSRDIRPFAKSIGASQARDLAVVSESDYIVPTVPLRVLDEVVGSLSPYTRPETVIFDTTSVKVRALEILSSLSCQFFSTHMLSPQRFVVCGDSDPVIEDVLRRKGVEVIRMSAEEHDRRNAVMGVAQFLGLALGRQLGPEDQDILRGSKSGQILLALVEHVGSNVPTTYQETQIDNTYTMPRREELINTLQKYGSELAAGNFPFE
jgi:prephenate dehydrogenase